MTHREAALELEADGAFDAAGVRYVRDAVALVADGEAQRRETESVGVLLRAIYCFRRAGADGNAELTRVLLERVASALHASEERGLPDSPESDRCCLLGLLREWVGDAHLMTGSDRALDHYRRAERWYDREADRDPLDGLPLCWGWGAEPEFDEAHFAFREYAEWRGGDVAERLPGPGEFDAEFLGRLQYKRSVAGTG